MKAPKQPHTPKSNRVKNIFTFPRFTLGQRWEHAVLFLSSAVLFFTGLPQKYRTAEWSQQILTTPERLELIRQIHYIAAVILTLEVIYHLGRAFYLLIRRKLPGDIFPTLQDLRDGWQMVKYLFFLTDEKPAFEKYNFEQKFIYWGFFFGIGIMVVSGFVLWFPIVFTRILPGGIIPAAKLAHSTEAIVAALFVIIWHFYHVHIERLNLSIFTGWLNERDTRAYHPLEYQRLTGKAPENPESGESQ